MPVLAPERKAFLARQPKPLPVELAADRIVESLDQLRSEIHGLRPDEHDDRAPQRPLHRLLPNAASLFQAAPAGGVRFVERAKPVPVEYLNDDHVACTCGSTTGLNLGQLNECACGRWFLAVSSSEVYYAPFPVA